MCVRPQTERAFDGKDKAMARERSGSFFKRIKKLENGKEQLTWWARVTYVDAVTGQRHDRQRRAQSKAHA
jgi:hypothetical protein